MEKIENVQAEKVVAPQLKEADKIVSAIEKLPEIKNEEDYTKATELGSSLKTAIKNIEDIRSSILKPFKDHIKVLEGNFRDLVAPRKQALDAVTALQRTYLRKQEEERVAEQKKLDEKHAKKVAKAEAKGESVFMPAPVVETVGATVKTESGAKSTARKVWVHEIENVHDLPLKIRKQILEKALEKGVADTVVREHVRAGEREMKGVRIYQDFQIAR